MAYEIDGELKNRLEKAGEKIKSSDFRKNKGLGNEVGYYIFDYLPEYELRIRSHISVWEKQINKTTDGFGLKVFDLYDIMIDYLEEQGFLEKCFEFEKTDGINRVCKAIDRSLRLSEDTDIVVNHIRDSLPEKDLADGGTVVFLIGVGKCYPVMRSHKVLNNLWQLLNHAPVVMFYPGKYDGQELFLFSSKNPSIKGDSYYRALPLV
jgi:hypothetical protein